jgi:DNA mismatch repair protein MutH
MAKMKLDEAMPLLVGACGKRFGELFAGHPEDLRTNKGNVGQLLLKFIGLKLDSDLTDFEDGELKTNKAMPNGMPLETMFITQISKNFDTLVRTPLIDFSESNLCKKICSLVYLPVVKDSPNAADWYFVRCIRIHAVKGTTIYQKFQEDYEAICRGLKAHIETSADGFIHTTNGPHYIQVRSKDSMPYHPISSQVYGRDVSNKNHALYFMKSFMIDAVNGRL